MVSFSAMGGPGGELLLDGCNAMPCEHKYSAQRLEGSACSHSFEGGGGATLEHDKHTSLGFLLPSEGRPSAESRIFSTKNLLRN